MKDTICRVLRTAPSFVFAVSLVLTLMLATSLPLALGADGDASANRVHAWFDSSQNYATDGDSVSNINLEGGWSSLSTDLYNDEDASGLPVTGGSSAGGPTLSLASTATVTEVEPGYLTSGSVPGTDFTWGLPPIAQGTGRGSFANLEGSVSFTPGFSASRSVDSTTFGFEGGTQQLTLTMTPEEPMDRLGFHGSVRVEGDCYTATLTGVEWVGDPPAASHIDWDETYFGGDISDPEVGATYTLLATFQVASTIPGVEISYKPYLEVRSEQIVAECAAPASGDSLTYTAGAGTWTWTAEGTYLWEWHQTERRVVHFGGYAHATVNLVSPQFSSALVFSADGDSVANTILEGYHSLVSFLFNPQDGTRAAVTGGSIENGPFVQLSSTSTVTRVRDDHLLSGAVPGTVFSWGLPALEEDCPPNPCWADLEGSAFFQPGFTVTRSADVTSFGSEGGTQHVSLTVTAEEAIEVLNVFGDVAVEGDHYRASFESAAWIGTPPPSCDLSLDADNLVCQITNPDVGVPYTLEITSQVDCTVPGASVEFMPDLSVHNVHVVATPSTPEIGNSITHTAGVATWTWEAEGDYLWNWSETAVRIVDLKGYASVFLPVPVISSLSPMSGAVSGGTVVTITGTGFAGVSGPDAVVFGATPAASYTVDSDTQITATAPAHEAGLVQVRVTGPQGASANSAAGDFTYLAGPPTEGFLITQLTLGNYSGANADVSGDRVVWTTGGSIFTWTPDGGIVEIPLRSSQNSWPRVSGDRVVWHGFLDGVSNYNFTWTPIGGTILLGTHNSDGAQVSGDRVVWSGWPGPGGGPDREVFTWTPEGGVVQITSNDYEDANPQVSGDRIVWQGEPVGAGQAEIYTWTPSEAIVRLTTNDYYDGVPKVSGDRVVWDAHDTRIFTWTPSGGVVQVSDDASYGWDSQVSGDRIVWSNYGAIFTWTPRGGVTRISAHPRGIYGPPQVSGDRVVWGAATAGINDIFTWTPDGGTVQVTHDHYLNSNPRLSGDRLVWHSDMYVAEVFTAVAVPVAITGLEPAWGLTAGGTKVTISGVGFTGATAVTFDGIAAPFTVDSDTQITAVSPGHASGTVQLQVTTPEGVTADTVADDYYYLASPSIAACTERVSVNSQGAEGDFDSNAPSINADGRFVTFQSYSENLVSGDTNNACDVFVRDRMTGETTRVSVDSFGNQTNWQSSSGSSSISADGRYVAFQSNATNLVPGDTNGSFDVFVHDRLTGETTRVSVDSAGVQGLGHSYAPSISADGRYVAFWSYASNLVPADTDGEPDVFVHDRLTGETTVVSVDSSGNNGNGLSPCISGDGRYVAFSSSCYTLVPDDTNHAVDVFVHDRMTGETTRVSVDSTGSQVDGGGDDCSISADGRYVAFHSGASNLTPDDTNGTTDVFVHDRATGETTRVSLGSSGNQGNGPSQSATISADGCYVAFQSYADNLVPDDLSGAIDVFVHDRMTGQTTRVSVDSSGHEGDLEGVGYCLDSVDPCISGDGRYVAFKSDAGDLTPVVRADAVLWEDIYVAPVGLGANLPGVWPTVGLNCGGDSVVITGHDFYEVTAVNFGTTAAIGFTVDSPNQITAIAPAHASGTVQVQVITPEGASPDVPADDYTYLGTAPEPPTGLVAADYPDDNGEAVRLAWKASEGAAGYKLLRGTVEGEYDYEVDLGNLLSYVDTGLTPGQTYYYAVLAYGAYGNLSELSVPATCAPEDNNTETEAGWAWAGAGVETEVGDVAIVFDEVTVAGSLTVTPETPSLEAPSDFRLLDKGWSVDPGTVEFTGEISIGFPYDPGLLPPGVQEEDLTIWHYEESGGWQNVTDWVDTENNVVWARVASLSPFVLMAPANQTPVVQTITATPLLVALGRPVTLTGSFTDPDKNDEHTATWQWDRNDPTEAPGTVVELGPTSGQVEDTHTYTAPGVYEVTLRVTDAAGARGELSYQYVVVYDPNGSFVTGGGWILSPAGAYVADPSLTGPAVFGFVSKYKKGANVPTGNTEFQFRVADLNFNSTSYDWLVVAGNKAKFKGTGTINGAGDYGFMISAIDGDLKSKSTPDMFRIKIWDKLTGVVVYDNELGSPDDADPTTVIGGGSIVIHK